MKFRFRAEKEDLLIFGVFAIFLLYIISIAVVNLSTFATEGYLSGFNPLPAFSPKYIGATLTFYLLTIGGLFVSVSSYFFDREKGFGLTTEKKDKGYSRWAKDKEIQEELEKVEILQKNAKVAGVPLMLNDKEMWVDDSEYHSLIIGATGSGKTQTQVLPMVHSLAKKKESMIITDPKGEIYEKTSMMLRERGYQILLLNFRDPQNGNAWNPMTLPYNMYKSGNQDKAIELLDDLALNILYDDSNKNADPFWEKTSADYFSGVALGLFEDAKPEEININSISLATTVGEEKFGGSTYIKEYFGAKDPASAAAINASSTIMAPNETKGSILSVFKQKVKLFASRANLSEMLSHSDIDLESIGVRPTAVFIVIQDEKKTYHSLVTILLKQIYETLISTAQKHGGKLPVRTNFILDEFANMPPLKDVTTMITAARSRAIRFTMIIQNFAQLDSVYGKEDAETIRGNCGNIIYLITTELKALEEISKMCGEVKSKKDDKTASTPLVTVSDLQRMKQFEVIIMRMRKQPFKTKFTPYFKLDWGKKWPKATYPSREKEEVHTFDIKEFVKSQKKKKLLDMMNAADETAKKELPEELQNRMRPANREMDRPIPRGLARPEREEQQPLPAFLTREDFPVREEIKPRAVSKPQTIDADFADDVPRHPEKQVKEEKEDDAIGFDVDELVKKIDAKIAELEAEEKREKEAEEKKNKEKKQIQETTIRKEEIRKPKMPITREEQIKNEESHNSINDLLASMNDNKVNQTNNKYDRDDFVEELPKVSKPEPLPELSENLINKQIADIKASNNIQVNKDLKLDDEDDDDFFDDFFDN